MNWKKLFTEFLGEMASLLYMRLWRKSIETNYCSSPRQSIFLSSLSLFQWHCFFVSQTAGLLAIFWLLRPCISENAAMWRNILRLSFSLVVWHAPPSPPAIRAEIYLGEFCLFMGGESGTGTIIGSSAKLSSSMQKHFHFICMFFSCSNTDCSRAMVLYWMLAITAVLSK